MEDVVKLDVREEIYVEEVMKCLTPEMVAEKRTYFESRQKNNQPTKEMKPLGQNQQIHVNPLESNATNSHNSANKGEEGQCNNGRYEEIHGNNSVNANQPNLLIGGSSEVSSSETEISELKEGASHALMQFRCLVNDLKSKIMEEKSDELRLKSRSRPDAKKAITPREMKLNAVMKKLSASGPSSSVVSARNISPRVSRSHSQSESGPSLLASSASCRSSVSACSVLPPATTSRRALVMEKMGHEGIVQRAFKALQGSVNLFKSSSDKKITISEQVDGGGKQKNKTEMTVLPRNRYLGKAF